MHSRNTLKRGALLAAMLTLPGCASKPIAVAECPRYVPSPEALAPIQGTGWRQMGDRVVEHFRDGKTISPPP